MALNRKELELDRGAGEISWSEFKETVLSNDPKLGETWMALVTNPGAIMEDFALLGTIESVIERENAMGLPKSGEEATYETVVEDILRLLENAPVLLNVFKSETGRTSVFISPNSGRIFVDSECDYSVDFPEPIYNLFK